MGRRDDVSKLYKIPNILNTIETVLFWMDVIVALIALYDNQIVTHIAITVQIIAAIFYFLLSVIDDGYFWYEAEKARRKNSIENGFGIRLSELETEEYYNNQIEASIEKYALNALESNLHSKNTAGKMIISSCIKSGIAIAILMIVCRFVTNFEVVLVIAQTAFSSYVLIDTMMLVFYKLRLETLYKEGYAVLISPGTNDRSKNATFLAYAVEYEAIKAHYKIRLSEKIFNKNNAALSAEWEQIISHRAGT